MLQIFQDCAHTINICTDSQLRGGTYLLLRRTESASVSSRIVILVGVTESQVNDFHVIVHLREHDVLRFYVTMQNVIGMQAVQSFKQLNQQFIQIVPVFEIFRFLFHLPVQSASVHIFH